MKIDLKFYSKAAPPPRFARITPAPAKCIDFLAVMAYNRINTKAEENMMKKILFALFAVLMIFAFSACGSSSSKSDTDSGGDTDQTTVTSDSDLTTDSDEPRYTSDGDLIVEEERPASDSDLSEGEN